MVLAEAKTNKETLSIRGLSILVVEDDAALLKLYSIFLRTNGAIVISAQNGQEALEIVQESIDKRTSLPDLIISDFIMPVMGGEKLIENLGKFDRAKNIPFVVISAPLEKEQIRQLLENPQVTKILTKPVISLGEIIKAAESALEVSRFRSTAQARKN